VATLPYLMFTDDVTVTSSAQKSQLLLRIKFPTKRIFWIFDIGKTNRMMLFCNLFMERPLYVAHSNVGEKLVESEMQLRDVGLTYDQFAAE